MTDEEPEYDVPEGMEEQPVGREMLFQMQEPTGLFNTFRLGRKWADVGRNTTVNLMRPASDGPDPDDTEWERYGVGLVLRVDSGPIEDMLDKHVGLNHGVQSIAQASDQRLALVTQLEDVYGQRLPTGTVVTVVYVLGEALGD